MINNNKQFNLFTGDSYEILKTLPDNSIDSIVTDPPYGLSKQPNLEEVLQKWLNNEVYKSPSKGFMGKDWDSFVPSPILWKEAFRVLKPGGHILAFAGTRTQHLMAMSLGLAGFEIRDVIFWAYGSGFPKSHNVGNSIDKLHGAKNRGSQICAAGTHCPTTGKKLKNGDNLEKYAARTKEGEGWEGWGTALKPAVEPITLARKPISEKNNSKKRFTTRNRWIEY